METMDTGGKRRERGRRSFLLYRDNAPMIRMLPLEEAGLLLVALLDYADRIEEGLSPTKFLEERDLPFSVALVFGFVAANMYRDDAKWRRAKENREEREAAKRAQAIAALTQPRYDPPQRPSLSQFSMRR